MTELPITSFAAAGSELPITSFGSDAPVESFAKLHKDDVLADPLKMSTLREYMKERKGVKWADSTDEDLLDTFMTHMRNFSTNELRTITEGRFIMNATDEQKAKAAAAYELYDNIGPFWNNGDGFRAVKDYATAILTSPSTYMGAIAGKIAGGLGAKVASAGIISMARQAAKTGGIQAAKSVLAAGARQKAITTVATAAATDIGIGAFQDYAYQKIMKDSGAQEGHDYLQTAFTLGAGLVGGAVSLIPELRKGSLGITSQVIRTSKKNRVAQSATTAAPRIKNAVKKLATQANELKSGNIDWQAAVAGGAKQNPTIEDLINNVSWFFDIDDPDSLVRIVIDSGAPIKLGADERFTSQIIDFMSSLPQKELDEINDILQPALGLNLGQMIDRIAVAESRGGSVLQRASRAKQYAKEFAHLSAANKATNEAILNAAQSGKKEIPPNKQYLSYIQSLWRRMLVSHPGTTAINIQGWGMAYMARSMAEILDGSILGVMGVTGKLLGQDFGDVAMRNSKALFGNQIFKLSTLLDPYSTREAFDALAVMAKPKIRDAIVRESFGGVTQKSATELFGITDPNMAVRGAESVANLAAKASFIKAQDVYTKAFSGLGELDKQIRLGYGKGLKQLIADGEHHKITDEMWDSALGVLLKDTFSYDYTKTGPMHKMADLVEGVSDLPGVGFLFPFGRFMNNNLAFVMQYSPISMATTAFRISDVLRKDGIKGLASNTDLIDDVGKAVVGTVALATLLDYSMQGQDEGRQWFEVEDSSGDITSEQNMAPISNYRLGARIIGNLMEGKSVPKELVIQTFEHLGPFAWAKELQGDTPLNNIIEYIGREDNPDELRTFGNHLTNALKALTAQVGAGFSRPLDPANKIAGVITGEDAAIDRRQESGMDSVKAELMRYTDNLFEVALMADNAIKGTNADTNIGTTMRSASRPEGDIHDPNPIGSLVGRKEIAPKNYTDKMLGQVNIPAFMFDQRTGIPEADRFLNEELAPMLNVRAKNLMERDDWKKGSQAIKHGLAKTVLINVRDDIRKRLQSGLIGTVENGLEDQRRIWLTTPTHIRDEVRKDLNIGTPDRELTEEELRLLRYEASLLSKYFNSITE